MTSKNEMGQNAENSEEKIDADNVIKHKEGRSSGNNKPAKKSAIFSRMLLTIILAFTVLVAYAYFYMPDTFNEYLTFNDTSESVNEQATPSNMSNQNYVPSAAVDDRANGNQHHNQSDWAVQQRAEFEKRRADFQQRMTDNYTQQWQQPVTPPEPPQWVKDRQAEMENQRQQYMREMAEQQARWVNSQGNNQTAMNPNQQPVQQQMPYGQYQGQGYNPYQQPQYNRPAPMYQPSYNPAYNNGGYGRPYYYQGNGYGYGYR